VIGVLRLERAYHRLRKYFLDTTKFHQMLNYLSTGKLEKPRLLSVSIVHRKLEIELISMRKLLFQKYLRCQPKTNTNHERHRILVLTIMDVQ